ncbi:homologous-pairing protein 2 homolog [Synchiropus splendidus]|uniref:homologous-pairing protein 2 homolog n=1 Tax=Synchiropus splendidus TaxID=270530 RepID=UPI00237DA420|nr:homologous-pairing protein 2 homolog [Synchiropus splendidus]
MSETDNATIILDYLNGMNRPYDAETIFCNLQEQHGLGKNAVVKALESLALEGKIKRKIFGIHKIYFADQAQFKDVSVADLKKMDDHISGLTAELQSISSINKQLSAELKELKKTPTTDEMVAEIQELKEECATDKARLEKIKSAGDYVPPEERERVCKERDLYVEEWRKRKRLALDMIDAIMEGYPKSKKELLEEIGIETDEDHGVVIPDK